MADEAQGLSMALSCCACCVCSVWLGLFVSVITLLEVNDTREIHANCRGLLDFVRVSLLTPVMLPMGFYCFIAPCAGGHFELFRRVACACFLAASVTMLLLSWLNNRCLDSLGEPPLLLILLGLKIVLFTFGAVR
jgi:hypothetical protein